MNKTVFFLVSLIVIAFSSSSKAVSFDGIMNKLIEMNEAAGKDKNQISLLIAKVNSATDQANEKFDKFIKNLVKKCQAGNRLQSAYISKIQADILEAKANSHKAEADNKTKENEKVQYGRDLAAAQKQLTGLKDQITKAYEQYRDFGIEAEQKLVVIKTLKDIITDELIAKHKKGQSFVQVETFNDKVRELQAMLKNAEDSMSPLVSTLLEMVESRGFSDKNTLSKILTVLNKLQASVSAFRRRQETDGKKNIENLKTQAKQKLIQVRTIAKLLKEVKSQIEENTTIIATSARNVKVFEKHQIRKTAEHQYWKKICKYQDSIQAKEAAFKKAFASKIKTISAKLALMN
jgi:hypothetical protein